MNNEEMGRERLLAAPVDWQNGCYDGEDVSLTFANMGVRGNPRVHMKVIYHPVSEIEDTHAIAAMCLHRHPFGFRQADVDLLSRVIPQQPADDGAALTSLLARIAALLPPPSDNP